MSDQWTVRAEGLSKKFGRSLKSSMRYGLLDSLTQLRGRRVAGEELREGEFWALKDVSFELNRGDSLGIMGVNGSGKSTLLRLLTGVYRPDVGRVSLRGTTGALIAAGAGFAPMLTGRENIFVNGALLGMSRATIEKRIDEIIAFAELEGFLDMPVKNYSSGMVVRLGFAIAAMSEPEILIVDEVLAVGDINFQKKCYDYLFRLKRQGTTIVLVSHSIGAIWSVCDRGLFMRRGEAAALDTVENVVKAYDEDNARASLAAAAKANARAVEEGADAPPDDTGNLSSAYGAQRGGTGAAEITSIEILDADGHVSPEIDFRAGMKWRLKMVVREAIPEPMIRLAIDAMHYRFISVIDSAEQGMDVNRIEPGTYEVVIDAPTQNFRPGGYKVNCAVLSKHAGVHLFYWFGATSFLIRQPTDRLLFADDQAIIHLDTTFRMT
jgi:lipopolysaccharide transport system ATP-binding protein